ncbi:class I SAM-dependent methyltransferase [Phenylobacterium sp. LjRoot225]|uniref:class I SAM-dependent methyltransferase n=1 Tax=Phenylobacterium sp. LjRoot225 TaxID=3342285 RepID=UPI003ECD85D2
MTAKTSEDRSHHAVVDAQFGPQAKAYVQSAVHASGADLDALEASVRRARPARALDIGCGGGHVAYRLAPHAGEVVACDLSAGMLAAVRQTAAERGLANIATEQAPAERLPFPDAAFDFVATRFSAHHWRDLGAGLAEARRVARAGSTAVFIDAISPGRPLLDSHLQAVELLRDPSHVRDYTIGEWTAAVERAGFTISAVSRRQIRMDFAVWTERMRTPNIQVEAVRSLQRLAADEVRAHFAIEPDGSFQLDVMVLEAAA